MSNPVADIESDLIDLTEVTLADLPTYDERILVPTMQRLLRRIDDPESVTTGYNERRALRPRPLSGGMARQVTDPGRSTSITPESTHEQ